MLIIQAKRESFADYLGILVIPILLQLSIVYIYHLHRIEIPNTPAFDLFNYPLPGEMRTYSSFKELNQRFNPSSQELETMFLAYANYYDIDSNLLRFIAFCESRFDPTATNGRHAGLYQFNPPTWQATRNRMNLDPDINLRFDPEEAIKTAAFKIHTSGTGAWVYCSQKYSLSS